HFVLHLGDVVDNGPDRKEWTDELFGPCRELFARVPVYPCIGNHEKNHAHYYRYFSLPKPEYYYSFKYGNAEFFSLDTNKPVRGGAVDVKAGVTYVTSGGGGGKLEDVQPTPAFFKNQGRMDYHYCYVTVFGGRLDFKAFDRDNHLFDQFSLRKE